MSFNNPNFVASITLEFFCLHPIFVLFFDLGFTARQYYFTNFEQIQLLGGAKTDHREKTPDHPQAELGLSHVTRARLGPTAVR